MIITTNTNGSIIELVDGKFRQRLNNGLELNLFLYKYRRLNNYSTLDDIFNTIFSYDIVIFDEITQCYLYFTYNYLDEPEEVESGL